MTYRKPQRKLDDNHMKIVKELEQMKLTVLDMSSLGMGAPDIAVGKNGRNYFFEIKNPDQPESGKKLTKPEEKFHMFWKGQIDKVETTEEILKVLNESEDIA